MPHWLKMKRVQQSARALHYYDDGNDYSEREIRDPGDDRGHRRLRRQESLLQRFVIVCVAIITTVQRRKRDRQ